MNDDTLPTATLTSSSQSTGVMLSPIKQDLMKGSRVCVSFQVNWWDTLSREQQLLYIQQHPSTTKKVMQAATKVGKAAVHLSGKALKAAGKAAASAGRSMIAASMAAKPKLKAAFRVLGSKGVGALSDAGKAVLRKDGVGLGIRMALVFAAGIAAGPVVWFAPLLATAYINWKLENCKDSDAPDIQNVTPNSPRRTRVGPRKVSKQAAVQPNSTGQPTASAPAQPTAATNSTPAAAAPVAAVAPTAPAPTNASTPAPAAPAAPVFKKAEKKERTAEEEADAMVDEFKSWLESGKAEELAAKIQSDKVLAKAAAKSKAIVEKMQKPSNKKKKKKQQQSKEAA